MKTFKELLTEAEIEGLIEHPGTIPFGRVRIISDTEDDGRQIQTGKDERNVLWVRTRPVIKNPNGWHPPITVYGYRLQQTPGITSFSDWIRADMFYG